MYTDFENQNGSGYELPRPIIKEQYTIGHGHRVQWGVLSIRPHWSEEEALAQSDAETPVDERVPWLAGIAMDVVALNSIDHHGIVRKLYAESPEGDITLPFGPNYMSLWTKLDRREVESGWARRHSSEGRTLRYEFPPRWNHLTPSERRAYWHTMLGGRYGFEPGELRPGSTFSAFFTRTKSHTTGKWYQDAKMSYKDEAGEWHSDHGIILGRVDLDLLRGIKAKIDEAVNQRALQLDRYAGSVSKSMSHYAKVDDTSVGF